MDLTALTLIASNIERLIGGDLLKMASYQSTLSGLSSQIQYADKLKGANSVAHT